MNAVVQVDVKLRAKRRSAGPSSDSIEFTYGPTDLMVYPGVVISSNGDIDVLDVHKDVQFEFILRTRSLSWGAETYSVNFEPKAGEDAADTLWISTHEKKPDRKWDSSKDLFCEFQLSEDSTDPASPDNTRVSVLMQKQSTQNPKRNYAYGLAVTLVRPGVPPIQVRDDPRIKNGGYGFQNLTLSILGGLSLFALGLLIGVAASPYFLSHIR